MGKTIYDVAREAGVGVATVSRALNGSGYVSEAAMEKIRKACEGYSRTPKRGEKVKSIGLVISHDPEYFFVNDTYLNAMIGISTVAKERDFRLVLEINNQSHRCLELFRDRLIDGAILMGIRQSSTLITELLRTKYPFVLIGDYLKESAPFCKIDIDDFSMAREAVRHLITLGHRRIGYICGPLDYSSCQKRADGYRAALAEAGLSAPEEYFVTCDNITEEKALNLAKQLLYQPNRVSAILAFNDTVAFAVYQAAREMGIRIPEGLSVISFDDSEVAKYVSPRLTTVRQPSFEKGYQAAQKLVEQIEHPEQPVPSIVMQGYLIFRDSCTPPPETNMRQPEKG